MPALIATIGANSDPMRRELLAVQRMADQTGARLQSAVSGHMSGSGGIMRESIVVLREILSGRFNARTAGSVSILAQRLGLLGVILKGTSEESKALATAQKVQAAATALAADSAAIAAEQNLKEASSELLSEYADKAKSESALKAAAAKYLSATASKAETAAAYESAKATETAALASKLALSPIGWLAAAVIAVGVAAFFVVRHILNLRTEVANLAKLMDLTTVSFTHQADAMKSAAMAAQEFNDWLNKLTMTEEGLAEQVEETITALREQAKFEQELAKKHGASPQQIAQMEIEATKKELAAIKAAQTANENNLKRDVTAAKNAEAQAHNTDLKGRIETAGDASKKANAIVEEIQQNILHAKYSGDWYINAFGALEWGKHDIGPDFKVGVKDMPDMSLNEAKANASKINAEEIRLLAIQKQLLDFAQEKKHLTEKDFQEQKSLRKEAAKLTADLALKEKYLPELAGADRMKQVHGHVSSLQQIGAYTSPAVSIQRQLLRHVVKIEKNTDHLGTQANHAGTAPHFGP